MQELTSADGEFASRLICFMVKSLASKYRDLVAIYPRCKLTAAKQYECYKDVHANDAMLHNVDVTVVAISIDNATANRKFFVDHLCTIIIRITIYKDNILYIYM